MQSQVDQRVLELILHPLFVIVEPPDGLGEADPLDPYLFDDARVVGRHVVSRARDLGADFSSAELGLGHVLAQGCFYERWPTGEHRRRFAHDREIRKR